MLLSVLVNARRTILEGQENEGFSADVGFRYLCSVSQATEAGRLAPSPHPDL